MDGGGAVASGGAAAVASGGGGVVSVGGGGAVVDSYLGTHLVVVFGFALVVQVASGWRETRRGTIGSGKMLDCTTLFVFYQHKFLL